MNHDISSASRPCLTAVHNKLWGEVMLERERQEYKTWGFTFDKANTINDWAAYANIYLGKATSIKATPVEQRVNILKAATLLIGALETFDLNGGFAPRHYDPEHANPTIPIDQTRVRTV